MPKTEREPTIFAALRALEATGELMTLTLAASVPFRMLDLEQQGGPSDLDWEAAQAFGDVLAFQGDVLMFREKKGQAAGLMADLIRTVAVMAFAPGGVTLLGLHFDAGRPDSAGDVCCRTGLGTRRKEAT